MHVFLIAAISANGLIAKNDHHLPTWTSSEDKNFFKTRTQKAGVCIFGSKTFQTIKKPLPDRLNIVYTNNPQKFPPQTNLQTTSDSPKNLLKTLKDQGYQEVAICGGTAIYSLFLKKGLIQTLYLTIEPLLFSPGLNLASNIPNLNLKLKNHQKLNSSTLLLEYQVI